MRGGGAMTPVSGLVQLRIGHHTVKFSNAQMKERTKRLPSPTSQYHRSRISSNPCGFAFA